MHKMFFALLLIATTTIAHAKSSQISEQYQRKAEQIVADDLQQIPAYDILAKQQKSFLPLWNELLRQQLIVGTSRNAHDTSQAIALGLALNMVNYFLLTASNEHVNNYFQQQRLLLELSQQNPLLCRILLNNAAQRADQTGTTPWLLDKRYLRYKPALQRAVTQLIAGSENQIPRSMPEEQSQQFMKRIVSQMVNTYGADSLKRYELMSNENANPETRCLGLHQLYETINTQPIELRAQLVRSFFGGQ
jgi:hypothetical protein